MVLYGSQGNLNCIAVLFPSVNLEVTGHDGLSPGSGYVIGEKQRVLRVHTFNAVQDLSVLNYEVDLLDGSRIAGAVEKAATIPAGGAVNAAIALRSFGVMNLCIAGPVGRGRGGNTLYRGLATRNLATYLWNGESTAVTLTIRDTNGQSTLFCEKPRYEMTETLLGHFRVATPRLFMATGVKPMDLPVVEEAFQHNGNTVRIFAPHRILVEDVRSRDRLMQLSAKADIFQINDLEAAKLLQLGDRPFKPDMIREAAAFGAKLTVVTMGARGAVARAGNSVWHQPAFPVRHVEDTCGAGDAFLATLVYCRYLRIEKPTRVSTALRAAAWVAAKNVQSVGPWSGIPSGPELEGMIKRWTKPSKQSRRRRNRGRK